MLTYDGYRGLAKSSLRVRAGGADALEVQRPDGHRAGRGYEIAARSKGHLEDHVLVQNAVPTPQEHVGTAEETQANYTR